MLYNNHLRDIVQLQAPQKLPLCPFTHLFDSPRHWLTSYVTPNVSQLTAHPSHHSLLYNSTTLLSTLFVTFVTFFTNNNHYTMPLETDPLKNNNGGDNIESPPGPPRTRRRKGHIPPLLICIITTLCIAAISIGVLVVVNAERRRRAPKQVWINSLEAENATLAQPGCESTVMLMRHCEKYGPLVYSKRNQHCSYLGLERAHFMPSLFGSNNKSSHGTLWPNPSYLYALSPDRGGHSNYRQVETLTPIATKLGLDINHDFSEGQETDVAAQVFFKLQSGDACGKLFLISWTHRSLPQLAAALGCGRFYEETGGCPAYYPEDSFDQVWMLKFVYEPAAVVLSHSKRKKHAPSHQWAVYPTITAMNFDPLAFSNAAGDYPQGGKATGGAWSKEL